MQIGMSNYKVGDIVLYQAFDHHWEKQRIVDISAHGDIASVPLGNEHGHYIHLDPCHYKPLETEWDT